MERFEVDGLIIGAGVIGLAAAAMARRGRGAVVVEAAGAYGTGISARNSEVVHAGVYYPPGSVKARLCVGGRDRLYAYCAARGVAHRRCGKLIVAAQAGAARLEDLAASAAANGAGARLVSGAAARRLEPALASDIVAAIHSPHTGIVDSHGLMTALAGEAEAGGGAIVLNAPVVGGGPAEDGAGVEVVIGGAEPSLVRARVAVNAAGLHAVRVARLLGGDPVPGPQPREGLPAAATKDAPRRAFFAKGSYFRYAGAHPFSRLIYLAPVDGGLGVHLTIDLGGTARFGP